MSPPPIILTFLVVFGCNNEEANNDGPRQRQQLLTLDEERTLAFEEVTDWFVYSGSGSIRNSTLSSEGSYSVQISGMGYAGLRNSTLITKDEHPAPEVVGYDVRVPANQPNPFWHGDTQLYIEAPSAGIWGQYLGYRSFQTLPKDDFVRVEFPLPDWIRQALDDADYDDLQFTLAINVQSGSEPHYVDNFTLGPDPGGETCTPVDDGNPCTADECDPATGQTIYVPLAPNAMCSDGNACNGIELCDGAGNCQAGTPPEVDDGEACTVDSCDPETGVTHTPVSAGASCSDGDACNGEETCDGAGACSVGVAPEIDDGNPCTADACDPTGGVTHTPVSAGVSCGDGNACNGDETCDGAGSCVAGTPVETDDGNPCTFGSCDPESGVVSQEPVPIDAPCGDGNLCNGQELCDGAGECVPGTPIDPDDGNACTFDSCDVDLGVINEPVPQGTSCVTTGEDGPHFHRKHRGPGTRDWAML